MKKVYYGGPQPTTAPAVEEDNTPAPGVETTKPE